MAENIIIDFMLTEYKNINIMTINSESLNYESEISETKDQQILKSRLPKLNNMEYIKRALNKDRKQQELMKAYFKETQEGERLNLNFYRSSGIKINFTLEKKNIEGVSTLNNDFIFQYINTNSELNEVEIEIKDYKKKLSKEEIDEIEEKIRKYTEYHTNMIDTSKIDNDNIEDSNTMKNGLTASFIFSKINNKYNNNVSQKLSEDQNNYTSTKGSSSNENRNILYEEYIKSNLDSETHKNFINYQKKYNNVKNYILNNNDINENEKSYAYNCLNEFENYEKIFFNNLKTANYKSAKLFALYLLKCLKNEVDIVNFLKLFFDTRFKKSVLSECYYRNILPQKLMEILDFISSNVNLIKLGYNSDKKIGSIRKLFEKISNHYNSLIDNIDENSKPYSEVKECITSCDDKNVSRILYIVFINLKEINYLIQQFGCTETFLIEQLLFYSNDNCKNEIYKKLIDGSVDILKHVNESLINYLKSLISRAENSTKELLKDENILISLVIKSIRECCSKCKPNLFYLRKEINEALKSINFKGKFNLIFLYEVEYTLATTSKSKNEEDTTINKQDNDNDVISDKDNNTINNDYISNSITSNTNKDVDNNIRNYKDNIGSNNKKSNNKDEDKDTSNNKENNSNNKKKNTNKKEINNINNNKKSKSSNNKKSKPSNNKKKDTSKNESNTTNTNLMIVLKNEMVEIFEFVLNNLQDYEKKIGLIELIETYKNPDFKLDLEKEILSIKISNLDKNNSITAEAKNTFISGGMV